MNLARFLAAAALFAAAPRISLAADPVLWGSAAHGFRLGIAYDDSSPAPQFRIVLENISSRERDVSIGAVSESGPVYNVEFTATSPEGKRFQVLDENALAAPPSSLPRFIVTHIDPGKSYEFVSILQKLLCIQNRQDVPLDTLLQRGYSLRASFVVGLSPSDIVASAEWKLPPAPSFTRAGVLPSDGAAPVPLAPGMLVSIYGSHLGPAAGCEVHAPDPSKTICGVQVFVGGVPANLLYAQARQINFKIPPESAAKGDAEVRVVYNRQSSIPITVPLGPDLAVVKLERPARVGMPVWLKVSIAGAPNWIQYPFTVYPAGFGCNEVEVRRDGKLLPRFASLSTQALGLTSFSGPPCGFLSLPAGSHRGGRIPLHLQYRFNRPGIYEVRYSALPTWSTETPAHVRSAWTRIEILPGGAAARAKWLTERETHAPLEASALVTDFLPDILGVPDSRSLRILVPYLQHSDSLVRQFAMYGLTYWPLAQASASVINLVLAKGPSDAAVRFLTLRAALSPAAANAIVEASIPYLQSASPVLLSGAIAMMDRIADDPHSRVAPAIRARAETALLDAEDHVIKFADNQTAMDYASSLGAVKNDRAGKVLWDLIARHIADGQAEIALTWRHSPSDLPKLAQLTLIPGDRQDRQYSSLPYALHHAYGPAAIPYLETMLARSEFTWVRMGSAQELVQSDRPSGFAFLAAAIEQNQPYRLEMIQFLRDRFPELRTANDPAILAFLKSRSANP